MNILIACEESQTVCYEFYKLGHNVFSCDLQFPSGCLPGRHICCDVLDIINGSCTFNTIDGISHYIPGTWDLVIAFPPCTYLSAVGASRLYSNGIIKDVVRFDKLKQAAQFFYSIYNCNAKRIAIENPRPMRVANLPPCSQVIQPYAFGENYSKETLLWLKNLPLLFATDIVVPKYSFINQPGLNSGSLRVRQINRSKFPIGIAKAMANQWC